MAGSTQRIKSAAAQNRDRRRRLWRRAAVAAVVVVVGIGAWQIVAAVTGPSSCGSGVVISGGECVGVTDDASAFDPSLATVVNMIAKENRNVLAAGDYVTVALLTPLTTVPGSDVTLTRIRQEMEGAYLAQSSWNGPLSGGTTLGYRPRIRLLLASDGSSEQAWPQVVRELQQEPASAHLVAVIGVGLSTTPTLQAARVLASGEDPVPMIGTIDTGDGLNSAGETASMVGAALAGPVQNLARVTPTTGDEVTVLHGYLGSALRRAMLVYDTNPDDLYTKTLGADFRRQFGPVLAGYGEPYDSSAAAQNEFTAIAGEVCPAGTTSPSPILYAGRESLLPTFIAQLRGLGTCSVRDTITVITGSDAESLPASTTAPNTSGPQVKVVYANLIDAKDDLAPAYKTTFTSLFGSRDLDATWAIMTYEAEAAAEQAARAAVGSSLTFLPSPTAVASSLFEFNTGSHPLQGATTYTFLISPDGNEACQEIPVVIYSGGVATTVAPTRPAGCPA